MNYEDIEKKLMADAENFNQKDFPYRWAKMQTGDKSNSSVEIKEGVVSSGLITESVTLNENDSNHNFNNRTLKVIMIIFAAVIALTLAIVLPLTLRGRDKIYFNEEQLSYTNVEESLFHSGIKTANIKIVDISEYSLNNYRLYYSEQHEVKGGAFEFVDESLGCYANVIFYDSTVKVNYNLTNYEICEVQDTQVKYVLQQEDDFYALSATTVFKGIYYRFDCDIVENNVYDIFNKFLN